MYKPGIYILMTVAVLVSGCIFDDGSDDKLPDTRNSIGIGAVASEYFPMKPGSIWDYETITTLSHDGETATSTSSYSNICEAEYTVLGTTYFRTRDNIYSSTNYWYDGDDVYLLIPNILSKITAPHGIVVTDALHKIETPFHDSEMDRLYYRFNVPVGTTWTIWEDYWTSEDDDSSMAEFYGKDDFHEIIISGKYLGFATVTTGFGTFEDCMKFEHTTLQNFQSTRTEDPYEGKYEEVTTRGSSTTITYYWFAPEIGLVKSLSIFSDSFGYYSTTETELTSYSYTGSTSSETSTDYSVKGKVVEWGGAGIPGVAVTVEGEGASYHGITDEDGSFTIDGLTQGNYNVHPSLSGLDIIPSFSVFNIVESDMHVGTFLGEKSEIIRSKPRYSAKTYLNFKNGMLWAYSKTEYNENGFPYESNNFYTCRGKIRHEDNDETYIKIDRGKYENPEYYKTDGSDVYLYEPSIWYIVAYAADKVAKTAVGSKEFDILNILNSEILYCRFNQSAGHEWEILDISNSRDSSYVNVCVSGKYAGLETVETEAGIYENCARFEICMQSGYQADSYKSGDMYYISGSETFILTRWFAPQTGMVKETAVRFSDGDSRQEDGSIAFESGEFRLESELVLKDYVLP